MSATDNHITERKEQERKMSCNGCRVLRKGCSENCILRQSLQWIESPQSQAHATVFVAKFFGRAGLMTFIAAVSEPERPALFKSLLYEACGRTVNPVHGAVGLLWTGKWQICQAAVQTVLSGGSLDRTPAGTCFPSTDANGDRNGMLAGDQWPNEMDGNFSGDDDVSKIYELGACVDSRRVRQKIDGNNNNINELMSTDGEKLGQRGSGIDGQKNDLKLDLSLNCPSKSKSSNLKQQRVSSPSTNSVHSEGSVNRLKSSSPPPSSTMAAEQKLLDLL